MHACNKDEDNEALKICKIIVTLHEAGDEKNGGSIKNKLLLVGCLVLTHIC